MYLGHRSRHVRRQGAADRRRPETVVGSQNGAARRSAPHPWLVGAGCRPTGSLRPKPRSVELKVAIPRASACRRARHRAVGPDARRDACSANGDRVLRPCILWNDTRSHAEAAALDADPRFRDHRQHRLPRLHRAEARLGAQRTSRMSFVQVRKVLLPKDYLRLWLTGEHISEMSDSAGTSWLDVGRPCSWSA
jgi:xylulokinase